MKTFEIFVEEIPGKGIVKTFLKNTDKKYSLNELQKYDMDGIDTENLIENLEENGWIFKLQAKPPKEDEYWSYDIAGGMMSIRNEN